MWGPMPGMPGSIPSGYKLDFGIPESPMPKDVYPDVFKTKEEASAALNDFLTTDEGKGYLMNALREFQLKQRGAKYDPITGKTQ